MRKLLIVVVGVLTMTACGNKTKSGETIDSTLVDSLMTDSVVLGVTDLWTVEAVEAQIRVCFEEDVLFKGFPGTSGSTLCEGA